MYKYQEFYTDKDFQKELIEGFRDLFLIGTIETIKEVAATSANLNTWVRDKKSTPLFIEKVEEKLQMDMSLEGKYKNYVTSFMH